MNYLFFDLETTGLARTSDILEFGGLLCDENLKIIRVYNEYFLHDEPVPASAINVHGLTSQKLEFLASRDFISAAPDIFNIVSQKDIYYCGHNVIRYDLPVLVSNLTKLGYSFSFSESNCRDTLQYSKKYFDGSHNLESTLSSILRKANLTVSDINSLYDRTCSDHIIDRSAHYHCALYDAFASWCAFTYFRLAYGIN